MKILNYENIKIKNINKLYLRKYTKLFKNSFYDIASV